MQSVSGVVGTAGAGSPNMNKLWLNKGGIARSGMLCIAGAFTVWTRLGHALKNNLIFYAILTVSDQPPWHIWIQPHNAKRRRTRERGRIEREKKRTRNAVSSPSSPWMSVKMLLDPGNAGCGRGRAFVPPRERQSGAIQRLGFLRCRFQCSGAHSRCAA